MAPSKYGPLHIWCFVLGGFGILFSAPVFFSSCDATIVPTMVHKCTATENWLNQGWAYVMIAYHVTIILMGAIKLDHRALVILTIPFVLAFSGGMAVWSFLTPFDESGAKIGTTAPWLMAWPGVATVAYIACALAHKDPAGRAMV